MTAHEPPSRWSSFVEIGRGNDSLSQQSKTAVGGRWSRLKQYEASILLHGPRP